ncbi:MAG: hypothetical protein WDZ60_01205, partial [Wenzhouxiangellaceae bacterium]
MQDGAFALRLQAAFRLRFTSLPGAGGLSNSTPKAFRHQLMAGTLAWCERPFKFNFKFNYKGGFASRCALAGDLLFTS